MVAINKEKQDSVEQKNSGSNTLQALTSAALILPGLLVSPVKAAEKDTVDIQYSHYQEGKREIFNVPNNRDPIEVDTFNLASNISLTDRINFAFNYSQDTWSGATPVTTSPLAAGGNSPIQENSASGVTTVGASPIINSQIALDHNLNPLSQNLTTDSQLVHVLSSASPETRKQGDFKVSYEWDEATINISGGLSLENDYESRYGGVSGRWDFNQKLTSLNLGVNYTNSDTTAIIDHDASPYLTKTAFKNQIELRGGSEILHGNKQDWGVNTGLTQIINKNALLDINLGYTNSAGYMENPYKAMTVIFVDPASVSLDTTIPIVGDVKALLEQRPNNRNQLSLSSKYVQYIEPLNAALHLGYSFSYDDWGINAHTFDAEWVQPFSFGWTVTPRVRYYSQSSADFYQPYLTSKQAFSKSAVDVQGREIWVDANNPDNGVEYVRDDHFNLINGSGSVVDESLLNVKNKRLPFDPKKLPDNFSSDHRLAAFGALSGGVTITKQFVKGVKLEAGFEYYTHAGFLSLSGNGDDEFSDFDSFTANAAISVDLNALSSQANYAMHSSHNQQGHHGNHSSPAGVMNSHMMSNAGDFMVGYRFMYSRKAGDVLHGTNKASDIAVVNNACSQTQKCRFIQPYMDMNMHMINIMYAPTDWLNLMIMPQFVDMEMNLRELAGRPDAVFGVHEHTGIGGHATGGVGDTSMSALFKLYDKEGHHLHLGLGVSAPTGDVDLKFRRIAREDQSIVHFGMQLGSGTWDFLPNITYSGDNNDWAWGAQVNAAIRMEDKNDSGYRLGDSFQTTAWGSYKLTHWLSTSVRGVYSVQGSIKHDFNEFSSRTGPMDFPGNHGGRFWDIGFGLNASVPSGEFAGNSFGFEWLQPIQDDVNGYQIEREGALTASWSYAF